MMVIDEKSGLGSSLVLRHSPHHLPFHAHPHLPFSLPLHDAAALLAHVSGQARKPFGGPYLGFAPAIVNPGDTGHDFAAKVGRFAHLALPKC